LARRELPDLAATLLDLDAAMSSTPRLIGTLIVVVLKAVSPRFSIFLSRRIADTPDHVR
jgi:neural Wiskott-Aldrich syndrome protein